MSVSQRREYLDWLRGVGVLIMIQAHTMDAWTRAADRDLPFYRWALVVGGFGTTVFLFLAGVSLALAAGSRLRKGRTAADVAAQATRRALQIFGLAFLFRLQSIVVSGGALESFFKVDILNIMGLSMLLGTLLWRAGRTPAGRAVLLTAAAAAAAMVTPIIRDTPVLSVLPDAIESYFRPAAGRTTFTMFPWAGFLLGGAAVGLWLDAARDPRSERRVNLGLAVLGAAVAFGAYGASFLPPLYARTEFWTSSPTFFFVRLGIIIAAVPLAFGWNAVWKGWSPLRDFGIASLFVYWIHVEMVYGIPSLAIHRRLSLTQWAIAYGLFTLFLFALVKLKDRLVSRNREGGGDLSAADRTSGSPSR